MNMLLKNKKWTYLLPAWLGIVTLFSCSKWDDYKKYTANGEILYTGKLDSVKVYSGKNRVRITGRLNADPKVTAIKVFWNNKADSSLYEVKRNLNGNKFDETIAIPEGIYTFTILTSDAEGNTSVPVNVSGVSYGNNYRRKLNNRAIGGLVFNPTGTIINWEAMDMSTGAEYTEVEYLANGVTRRIVTPVKETKSELLGLTETTTIQYRTVFRPDTTSIDTFSVAFQNHLVKIVPQLKNRQVPFKASATDGRWGNLADWKSNAAIRNHNGFGGWDEWNGNIFNVESGWGAPPINNGKLWQTLNLEAGTYTFEISNFMNTNLTVNDKAYLVVAQGTELPDVDQVATAIGSVQIIDGKSPALYKIKFTLTQKSDVSMGFISSQVDGWPGRFCNIRAFDFYEN